MTGRCRTPGKVRYGTEQHATAAAKLIHDDPTKGQPMFPYPCGCGGWHLASSEVNAPGIPRKPKQRRRRRDDQ